MGGGKCSLLTAGRFQGFSADIRRSLTELEDKEERLHFQPWADASQQAARHQAPQGRTLLILDDCWR